MCLVMGNTPEYSSNLTISPSLTSMTCAMRLSVQLLPESAIIGYMVRRAKDQKRQLLLSFLKLETEQLIICQGQWAMHPLHDGACWAEHRVLACAPQSTCLLDGRALPDQSNNSYT